MPIYESNAASSAASVLDYNQTEAVAAGATRLYQGYQVSANGIIAADTPFSWGTTGATWHPDQFASSFKGAYAAGTTYAANDIVAADATSTAMYKSLAAGNVGNALSVPTKWEAASFTVAPSTSISILAYQTGETYYAGQRVNVGGVVFVPNATIPAGTAFVIGTTGATWRVDASDNKMLSSAETFTGEYADNGKAIYQRFIRGTTTASLSTAQILATLTGITEVLYCVGSVKRASDNISFSFGLSANAEFAVNASNQLYFYTITSAWASRPYSVLVKYTK